MQLMFPDSANMERCKSFCNMLKPKHSAKWNKACKQFTLLRVRWWFQKVTKDLLNPWPCRWLLLLINLPQASWSFNFFLSQLGFPPFCCVYDNVTVLWAWLVHMDTGRSACHHHHHHHVIIITSSSSSSCHHPHSEHRFPASSSKLCQI